MEVVQEAYEHHDPSRWLLVRYEDLLADTETELARLNRWLGLDVSPDALRRIVSDRAFEAVPAADRGPGRFHRAAAPGLWRENMTGAEQELPRGSSARS